MQQPELHDKHAITSAWRVLTAWWPYKLPAPNAGNSEQPAQTEPPLHVQNHEGGPARSGRASHSSLTTRYVGGLPKQRHDGVKTKSCPVVILQPRVLQWPRAHLTCGVRWDLVRVLRNKKYGHLPPTCNFLSQEILARKETHERMYTTFVVRCEMPAILVWDSGVHNVTCFTFCTSRVVTLPDFEMETPEANELNIKEQTQTNNTTGKRKKKKPPGVIQFTAQSALRASQPTPSNPKKNELGLQKLTHTG